MTLFVEYQGYTPGVIGRLTELEARFYNAAWGFGRYFEARIATTMAEFMAEFDSERDGFWAASINGVVQGGISVDGRKADTEGAQLRWFFLAPEYRGHGIGGELMRRAMGFCHEKGYPDIFLWTFDGLSSALYLYEKHGFRITTEQTGRHWGTPVLEQKMVYAAMS